MKIKFSNNNLKDTYIDIPINYYYGYEGISEKDKSEYKLEKEPRRSNKNIFSRKKRR